MPPVSDAARFEALHAELADALAAEDWQAVGRADQAIAARLAELQGRPLDIDAQRARARLKALHARGRDACAAECERLRQLLLNHLDYAEGRAAYGRTELFQAGEGA